MARTSTVLVNGSTSTASLANPVPATSAPSSGYVEVPKGAKSVRLTFGGYHDTTPADNDFAYQVVLWRRTADQGNDASASVLYTPELVAKGVATLGTLVMQDSAGDGDYLYADTITNTLTIQRPDVLVFSPADNTLGWIYVELGDAIGIEVEVDCDGGSGTAVSKAYVFARFEEEAHPFFRLTELLEGVGTVLCVSKVFQQSQVTSTAINVTTTASDDLLIENAIIQNYAPTGATDFDSAGDGAVLELFTDNDYGDASFFTAAEAKLVKGCVIDMQAADTASQVVLRDGARVKMKATGEDFTSTGLFKVWLIFRRVEPGAKIGAA